jgi:FMN phosphatase YigB (HAD superfamily)
MFRAITDSAEVLALVRRRKPALVSFDLFDTLVYRTVARPKDVFLIQGRRLRRAGATGLTADEWLARRKKAERRLARSLAPGEVVLEQIYDALLAAGDLASGEARDKAMELELEIEREVIRLYRFVPELLAAVKNTGARVVVLSDIYLPQSFIRERLEPVAHLIDDLHCSSHVQLAKRHGQAYTLLKTGGNVLHFGDNRRSDCLRAWQNGIDGRLVEWGRARWLRRNRAAVNLLRLRGCEIPPLENPGQPPVPDSLEDLAVRWSIVLYDFLLDLRRQARAMGASDIWLASRDCETLWAVLSAFPDFLGPAVASYVRVSRKATHPLMARADPERYAKWCGRWVKPAGPEAGLLARRYYRDRLRPETRRILLVDMITRGRLEVSLRLALPPSVGLSGYYFSLNAGQEASCEARVYLPWRHDLLHGSAIEMLSGFGEGTLSGFRAAAGGAVEPVLESEPADTAPAVYLATLRAALARLIATGVPASEDTEIPPAETLIAARSRVVRPLAMFPGRAVARTMAGWHYSSPHDHPAHDVVNARAPFIRRLLALASRDNRWPAVAVHSAAPAWLAPVLQWSAAGRMKIKNRLDGVASPRRQTALLVGHDDRG